MARSFSLWNPWRGHGQVHNVPPRRAAHPPQFPRGGEAQGPQRRRQRARPQAIDDEGMRRSDRRGMPDQAVKDPRRAIRVGGDDRSDDPPDPPFLQHAEPAKTAKTAKTAGPVVNEDRDG